MEVRALLLLPAYSWKFLGNVLKSMTNIISCAQRRQPWLRNPEPWSVYLDQSFSSRARVPSSPLRGVLPPAATCLAWCWPSLIFWRSLRSPLRVCLFRICFFQCTCIFLDSAYWVGIEWSKRTSHLKFCRLKKCLKKQKQNPRNSEITVWGLK